MINGTYFKYNGFILLFEGGFMWGGKREGAGRKPIGTVRIRVPVDALEQVNEVIRAYKSGLMKSDPEIKVLKPDPEIKVLKPDLEIKVLKPDPEIKVLKPDPEIKVLKPVTEIKPAPLKYGTEIKEAPLKPDPEIINARKALERLSAPTRRVLKKSFGSLYKAALLGVRAESDGGIRYPRELRKSLDLRGVDIKRSQG
jgi:hypothetical protein